MPWLILLVAPAIVLGALAPPPAGIFWLLGFIILLGVPHGALDVEIARGILRPWLGPRLAWAWFGVFALPYLALAGLVLLAWHAAPLWTLAGFLAVSAWHFGAEDAPGAHWAGTLVHGGLPIAMPLLAHSADTVALFSTIAETVIADPSWLWAGAMAWLTLALAWAVAAAAHGRWRALGRLAALGGMSALLPPLVAFAVYFVCVHAPAHTAALIANPCRAPRVPDGRSALLRALPVTALTLVLGAALWPLFPGAPAPRLLALTIQCLAALTLPHMLLDAWATACESRQASRNGAVPPAPGTHR